ncbi:MAG: hypothetical protein PUJ20_08325, partial [Bacteroidales bacterium]|nr:hypothetical protein [Bacteroidales bacterium]MDY4236062.1 hypothetical protein [Sodaliphilus sp.]
WQSTIFNTQQRVPQQHITQQRITQQRVTQQHITQQRVTKHAEGMSLRDDDFLIGFNWVLMD